MKHLALAALAALMTMTGMAKAADIVLRWGDVVGGTHPQVMMIDRVAKIVKEKSGGRIEIQSFPGGQLGSSRDMIEAVANGAQQIVTEGAANFGQWVPYISVVEAPYIWRSPEQMTRIINGAMLADINKRLISQQGMRVLIALYYGTRHITTSNRKVENVADMKGFKIRVPENDVFKAMAESWGAKPTPMNFSELYLALKQGVVDGQENPLPTIKAGKFNEVQKYIILSGHIMTPRLVVVNEAFWQGLSAADRKIVSDAVSEGAKWADKQIVAAEESLISEFKKQGVTIITPDVESFRKATLSKVPAMFAEKWGKGTFERLQGSK
jgi:tripartite ATP-independent transporter DctP family solute receptor